jgi:hypothetical protein
MKIYAYNANPDKTLKFLKSIIGKDLWVKCLIPVGVREQFGFYWVMPKAFSSDDKVVLLSYLNPYFYAEAFIDDAMSQTEEIPYSRISVVDPIDARSTEELREEIRNL